MCCILFNTINAGYACTGGSSSDPTAAFTESMIEAIGCVVKDGGKSLAGNGTSSSVPPLQAAAPAAAPVVSPAIGDHMRLYSVMAESMLELHWLGDLSNPGTYSVVHCDIKYVYTALKYRPAAPPPLTAHDDVQCVYTYKVQKSAVSCSISHHNIHLNRL